MNEDETVERRTEPVQIISEKTRYGSERDYAETSD